jgi:hypothetical protein
MRRAGRSVTVRTLASVLFLIASIIIGLGAFGHGLLAQRVHEVLDPFPIEAGFARPQGGKS